MVDVSNIGAFDDFLNDDPESSITLESAPIQDSDLVGPDTVENLLGDNDVVDTPPTVEETPTEESGVFAYLRSRGIEDPTRLKFEGEDGETIERSFNDLTAEEQANVLTDLSVENSTNLTDEETEYFNYLHEKNLSPKAAMEAYAQEYLQAYLQQNPDAVKEEPHAVDDYSDEDLYAADLMLKYENTLTEDEIRAKVEAAKENPEIFEKEVKALRTYYKAQEDNQRQIQEAQAQEAYRQNDIALRDAITNFNGIYLDASDDKSDSIEIEDSDKADVYRFITEVDSEGLSEFAKKLQDPNKLAEIAWLTLKGPEMLSTVTRYWKEELSTARKENARLQKELDKTNKRNEQTVIKQTDRKHEGTPRSFGSIWDRI